jgi:hypothetical protein
MQRLLVSTGICLVVSLLACGCHKGNLSSEIETGYENTVAQLQTLNHLDELFPGSGPFSNAEGLPSGGLPVDRNSYCLAFSTSKPLVVSWQKLNQDTTGWQQQLITAFPSEAASIKNIVPSFSKRVREKDKLGIMVEKILLFNPQTARYYLIVTRLPVEQKNTKDHEGIGTVDSSKRKN